jgi:hypothetical protein
MNSSNQMDHSLAKIHSLINFLNYGSDDKYRFDDIELKGKKNEKLASKIQ